VATGGESNWLGSRESGILGSSDPAEAMTGKTMA
jgi:hypothetical protein